MTGIDALKRCLSAWNSEQTGQWLERGLRTLADQRDSDEWDLAFSPLLLDAGEPPLQQFHFAIEQAGPSAVAKLRAASGDLLKAWRMQDSAEYLRTLWSVALSLKPVGGLVGTARHFAGLAGRDRRDIERLRPAFDVMITAVLAYPDDEEQKTFLAELAKTPVWTADHSRQYVLHGIRQSPSRWLQWVRRFEAALRDSPNAYFARLARTVGPFELGRSLGRLNAVERLDWLFNRLKPHFAVQSRGHSLEVRVGSAVALVDGEVADDDDLIQVQTLLLAMQPEPGAMGVAIVSSEPETRMRDALSLIPSFRGRA